MIKKGNINSIIEKYKANNDFSDFLVEIMKLLTNDFKKNILAKIENKNTLETFSNVELFNIKFENKEINTAKPTYYYYSDIDIINKEIFKLIKEIFQIECQEEEREFLIGDNKIIMDFNLQNQISLIVGNYIDNYFQTDILFVFDDKEYLNNFYENFKIKGYAKTMSNIEMNKILYDEQSKKIGYIYNIEFLHKYQITEEKQNSSLLKTDSNTNINEPTNNNSISSFSKLKKNEHENSSGKKEIIKLNYFFQNQIKALISYYYFIQDLKSNILFNRQETEAVFAIGKCYLVDETWSNLYKINFLYQELIRQIKKIQEQYLINEPKQNLKKIFDCLEIEFIKTLKEKEKGNPEELLKTFSAYTDNFDEKHKDENILIYPCIYDILNKETFELINKDPKNEILSSLKDKERDYLINEGKLIIKIESNSSNRHELLIGNFNAEIEKFIPKLLFKYNSGDLMEKHFEKLKQCKIQSFKESHTTSNGKDLTLRSNGTKPNQIIGTIYELKDVNWKKDNINVSKINENINKKQEKEKEKTIIKETQSSLSEIQKVHIKFLYSLHLFYEDLENEINI